VLLAAEAARDPADALEVVAMPDWRTVNANILVQTAASLVQALVERAEWRHAVRLTPASGPRCRAA
jgi:hypothetical protein